MASTRKARVPIEEQIRLINECRQSGMTDADWCRENDIAAGTFYNRVSRCRKVAVGQIPKPNYGHPPVPCPKQDAVPADLVPDHVPEQHAASQLQQMYLDNSHTIEVTMRDVSVRIRNDADPSLLTRTLRLLRETSCQVISPVWKSSTLSAAIRTCANRLMGLCAIIEDQLKMDPSSSSLFLFCGRRRDRIKALFHEPDGFVLIYKRLSVHGGYQWPGKQSEVRNLSWREFDWLMSGINIDQPKALKTE